MKTNTLSLSTLSLASPEAADGFQRLLAAAVLDCKQRPSCDKARTVVLKLSITPRENDPEDVVIEPQITSKTPARVHECFVGRAGKTGQLVFDFNEPREDD